VTYTADPPGQSGPCPLRWKIDGPLRIALPGTRAKPRREFCRKLESRAVFAVGGDSRRRSPVILPHFGNRSRLLQFPVLDSMIGADRITEQEPATDGPHRSRSM
jgi:hypothetical protein